MLVNDRVENIGTSECRFSSELYECGLNRDERSLSDAHYTKPTHISSRRGRVNIASPAVEDTHNLYSARRTLC